jgi:GTPase
VGLVGLPNAGKSSLLGRLTRAAPKIADYPFTTVEPVLGTLEADDRQLVIADVPGLIEGAAEGAGLGHEFLAHAERCRMLVHVVDVAGADPIGDYETVRGELSAYGAGLESLPELVVLAKRDLAPEEAIERALAEWRERLAERAVGVLAVSAVTGAGIDELRREILSKVPIEEADAEPQPAAAEPRFETEHRVYRPTGVGGFAVEREDGGAFRVEGKGIELLVRRHDLSNDQALAYLEERLREIGVLKALRDAGFEPGDEVHIGDEAFELHTGSP